MFNLNRFHVWISILTEDYKSIITDAIKEGGYSIVEDKKISANDTLSSNKCLTYIVETELSIDRLEYDICYNVLNKNNIKYHFYLVTNIPDKMQACWRGSNIDYNKINVKDKDSSTELSFFTETRSMFTAKPTVSQETKEWQKVAQEAFDAAKAKEDAAVHLSNILDRN